MTFIAKLYKFNEFYVRNFLNYKKIHLKFIDNKSPKQFPFYLSIFFYKALFLLSLSILDYKI